MQSEKQYKIFIAALIIIFAVLFGRLFQLMLFEGEIYSRAAEENASKTIPLPAPRGIIYDRTGRIIVSNQALFSVYVIPYSLKEETLKYLSKTLQVSAEEIKSKIAKKKYRQFEPLLIKDRLPLEVVIRLEEEKSKYPGFTVMAEPRRFYPYGKMLAHVLGYVGWEEKGEEGVEAIYDEYLKGAPGGRKIEVDARGRPVRVRGTAPPTPGNNLTLTIDIKLQEAVEKALGYYTGAIVALNPRNGEILALASHPTFDPNDLAPKLEAPGHPFMNRALSLYPPGSTFKVVTLSAALEEAHASTSEVINCRGEMRLGNRVFRDWKVHGKIGVLEALIWSCDIAFYELGLRLGPKYIKDYASAFGLGEKTGIDVPQEKRGIIPDESWKKSAIGERWYRGDTANMAIGQGYIQLTPLQLASLYGGIANGKRFMPHVADKVVSRDGKILFNYESREIGGIPLSDKNLTLIREALRETVERGTGIAAKVEGLPAAGKTGTAQNPGRPHAWFVSYAPYYNPEIVIAAFVEHGEHGDRLPAYMTRQILEWYKKYRFEKEAGG